MFTLINTILCVCVNFGTFPRFLLLVQERVIQSSPHFFCPTAFVLLVSVCVVVVLSLLIAPAALPSIKPALAAAAILRCIRLISVLSMAFFGGVKDGLPDDFAAWLVRCRSETGRCCCCMEAQSLWQQHNNNNNPLINRFLPRERERPRPS